MKQPPKAVAQAIKASAATAKTVDLDELRQSAANALELEQTVADLEERLKDARERLRSLYYDKLPTLMHEAGVDHIGLPASGNSPAKDYRLTTAYSASIAQSWPEEKRTAAFAFLKSQKAEALIKAKLTAELPKGNLKLVEKLAKEAKKLGINARIDESVHHGTLSAWLKELYTKRGKSLSSADLEKIGAFIGPVVKPKDRDDG